MHSGAGQRLKLIGQCLLISREEGLSDSLVAEYLDAFEDQYLEASHLARLRRVSAEQGVGAGLAPGGTAGLAAELRPPAGRAMKLACQQVTITADEHRLSPSVAQVYAGGSVRIAVTSGPAQSFEIVDCATQDSDVTPLIPAGKEYEWVPATPGAHSIASHIYPGCKARVVVQPAPASRAAAQQHDAMSSSCEVDEPIRLPLRTSRAAQTDPISSTSRFTSTSTLSLLRQPFQTACTAASVLPGITSAAAAAISASTPAFPSPELEELDVFNQTGLRRRGSQRPVSAGSAERRNGTPDLGQGRTTPSADLSVGSGTSSQASPRATPTPLGTPIFRPTVRGNLGSDLHSRGSPVSTHSSEETMPLLDIRMNRTQGRPNPVFPTARSAMVSPTSVASRDTTHKCPRCRKEFLSTINQRRCLAVHLGHKAGTPSSKAGGTKATAMPDRAQLVEFWDGLDLAEKQAIISLKSEAGSDPVLRNMEVRVLQRDVPHAHTTGQRAMLMVGRTLFEVLVRGNGLESLSGEALARLLDKASEGTFLYDRAMPARGEVMGGFNPEAALSALVSKRLVDALLTHRQEQAERVQRELEELEEAHKGDKGKPAEKVKKKQDKKAKPKALKPKPPGKVAKAETGALSRSGSSATSASEASALEDAEFSRPVTDGSARAARAEPAATASTAGPAAAVAEATVTPARSAKLAVAAESDSDLTPPSAHTRYTATTAEGRSTTAARMTYENALFSEGEDVCASGSWQPAVKGNGRGQHGLAGGRSMGVNGSRHGPAACGDAQRSSSSFAGEAASVRASQQQQQQPIGAGGGQRGPSRSPVEHPEGAAARPGIRPAPAASTASHGGRPGAGATPAKPAAAPEEEAFPALPSRAAPKGEGAATIDTTAGAGGPAQPLAVPKQPAAGISYAAAAKAMAGLGKQVQPPQQASGMGIVHAGASQQQPTAQALPAATAIAAPAAEQPAVAAAVKLLPPLPVQPVSQPASAPAGGAQWSGASIAPVNDTSAAAEVEEAAAAPAAPAPAADAGPFSEPSLAAAPANDGALVQQMTLPVSREGAAASSAAGTAPAEQYGLEGGRSFTPPLDVEGGTPLDRQPGAFGPQDGRFLMPPPFGYPPPPVGYYYFPVPVPTMQFGDVDMGEILQEHQQPSFYLGYPPPPLPFGGPMPPYPLLAITPAGQPMQHQPFPPHEVLAGMVPEPAQAAVSQQLERLPAGPEAARPAAATEAATEPAGGAADAAQPSAEAAVPAGELVALSQEQPQQDQAPASSASGVAARQAAAESAHLAGLLQAAGAAQRQYYHAPAFDAAAAAWVLASRWQAAVAQRQSPWQRRQLQPVPQQEAPPLCSGDNSEGSWRSGSPARGDRQPQGRASRAQAPQQQQRQGAGPRGEWRPVLREQQPPQAAAAQEQACAWGKVGDGPSGAGAGGAGPTNGASRVLSFAAVARGTAKSNGRAMAVRGWNGSEEGGEGKWRIQAAK